MKAASQERIWVCADGRKIRVEDMSDSHLANALAMLQRKGFISQRLKKAALEWGPDSLAGEHAQDAVWQEYADLMSAPCHPAVEWLEDETRRRKAPEEIRK